MVRNCLFLITFLVLNLSLNAQNKTSEPPTIKQVSKKLRLKNIERLDPLLIDSVSQYGVYKVLYYDEYNNKKRWVNFLYVDSRFYHTIKTRKGINQYYNKGYSRLKKYFKDDRMKEVEVFFLEKYPPKI